MSQQEEDVKPSVRASATPSTPTKKKSGEKTPTTPNKSPAKLPPGEMQRGKKLALEALMDFAVKGPMVDIVAEKSGLSKRQLGDLFRAGPKNFRHKVLSQLDSGSL